jgi:hypothetical protein
MVYPKRHGKIANFSFPRKVRQFLLEFQYNPALVELE